MIDFLEIEGYLQLDMASQNLNLTPEAQQILFRGKELKMPVRKEEEEKETTEIKGLSIGDAELYEALREKRMELARDSGVPPFVIFSNATLLDMVKIKPTKMSQFRKVSGVGELKANWYGKEFLRVIKENIPIPF